MRRETMPGHEAPGIRETIPERASRPVPRRAERPSIHRIHRLAAPGGPFDKIPAREAPHVRHAGLMDETIIYQEFRAWLDDHQRNPDEDEWTDGDLLAAFRAGADLVARRMLVHLKRITGE